ncbi:peptidylprolyl isomerase [Croceiramulus getboli]|nr:peptidylprolyl isomerase [Flavobacteriaceae bacterium YJPT1-3]
MKHLFLSLVLVCTVLTSCKAKYPDLNDGIYAEIITNKGTMLAELYYQQTPATVASFVSLAEGTSTMVDSMYKGKPFYNGLTFHRVVDNFVIQGGDPDGNGLGGPGYKFHTEPVKELKHDTLGVLSMANSGGFSTNGSQFFITEAALPHLDSFDNQGNPKNCDSPRVSCHTVFGQLIQGHDVLKTITDVEKVGDPRQGKTKEEIVMQEVNIIRVGKEAKGWDAPAVFQKELEKLEAIEKQRAKKIQKIANEFAKQKKQAEKLKSGLEIYYQKKGDGEKPALGSRVLVNYAGYFQNGEVFDTNIEAVAENQSKVQEYLARGTRFEPSNMLYSNEAALIGGFKEGLQQLNVGDKATLFIPYYLGYGERDYGPIPGKSDLIFEVEIVGKAE